MRALLDPHEGQESLLSKLYDLEKMPARYSPTGNAKGEVVQHRLRNEDWEDTYVVSDGRFGLIDGDDETFLNFLCLCVHPETRSTNEARRLVSRLNVHLARDGWALTTRSDVSGYPVFAPQRRESIELTVDPEFPFDVDEVLASVVAMLRERGAARELAVLAASALTVEQVSYDNWNGGTTGWALECHAPPGLYARLTSEAREATEKALESTLAEAIRDEEHHFFQKAVVLPRRQHRSAWRAEAESFVTGRGTNNQGRVRSDNIASLECDGLLFRSQPEILLYRAFKELGVTFAPLPVFIKGGESYARLEPDFVVLRDGVVLVVEVDGDGYHHEAPAEAHARLTPLDHEGAKIERVTAKECSTPERAHACAKRLLAGLDRTRSA